MSIEALAWALRQRPETSSAKFVLVALANCADGVDFIASPPVGYAAEVTGQDRKTVLANLARLRQAGYIVDTGERVPSAGARCVVWRLAAAEVQSPPKREGNRCRLVR